MKSVTAGSDADCCGCWCEDYEADVFGLPVVVVDVFWTVGAPDVYADVAVFCGGADAG